MSISDKTHLLEESFRIAEAGQLKYDIPLNMALYLKNENNYVPWSVASTVLTEIKNYLTTSEQLAQYKVRCKRCVFVFYLFICRRLYKVLLILLMKN